MVNTVLTTSWRGVASMQLIKEYKNLLKFSAGEEFFDLIVHRPLAYLVVKMVQPLPVSANHITAFSVLVFLSAACSIATSHPPYVFVGGLLILLGNTLDCADGQLARLRGTSSQYGRILDGVADYISLISLYAGIALWQPPLDISRLTWILLVAATTLAFGWQSSLVDYYRNEFSSRMHGQNNFAREELQQTLNELTKEGAEKRSAFSRFVLRSYASYLKAQHKSQKSINAMDRVQADAYVEANAILIRLWCLNGSATPRFFMIIACMLQRLDYLVAYVLVFSMIWTVVLLILQKRSDAILIRSHA